ncbi:uncharacterized protein LOC132162225 [Corylus avellana]|uniref:uncharacterized protein LOC132162225 n=1 Tax=Corylus avellana TaxID=13451 RepID=UPI00286C43E6|nr:uncharacterized protein LOC132162225 [Corylus avellana]
MKLLGKQLPTPRKMKSKCDRLERSHNQDLKIVGVGLEKPLQKLKDDCDLHVAHALDLGTLAPEKFAKSELRKAGMTELVMKLLGEQLLTPRKMRSRCDRLERSHD